MEDRGSWKQRARFVAAALAVPVAYQIFRMGFYGSLVANTAIAKEGEPHQLGARLAVLLGLRSGRTGCGCRPSAFWSAATSPSASSWPGRATGGGALVVTRFRVCGLLNALYVIVVGGDYYHARLFLPALFAVCAPVAAVPVARRHVAGLVVVAWTLVAVVSLRPAPLEADNWAATEFVAPPASGDVTTDDYGWGESGPHLDWYAGPAYYYEAGILQYPKADMAVRSDLDLPFGAFWGVGVSGPRGRTGVPCPGPDGACRLLHCAPSARTDCLPPGARP